MVKKVYISFYNFLKAPEILSFQKYDIKADLWSVGSILYEMLTGKVKIIYFCFKNILYLIF